MRSDGVKSQLCDPCSCGRHLIRYNVAVDVHCGSYVRMPHHLLLHGNGRAHRVQPRALGVPESVCPEVPELRGC